MNVLLASTCLAVAVTVASAHLCLLSPVQRGSISGLDAAGSNDCVLLSSPCGGRAGETAVSTFRAGMAETVIFQKNLDHWASTTPGNFEIRLMQGSKETLLKTVPDMGEKSLTLYTESVMIPTGMHGQAILQVTYVTKNPQAPAVFYQCADVMVH